MEIKKKYSTQMDAAQPCEEGRYYATVHAINNGGPSRRSTMTSDTIIVDSTPPKLNSVHPSLTCSRPRSPSLAVREDGKYTLEACWSFEERDSWITQFAVAWFNVDNLTNPISGWQGFVQNTAHDSLNNSLVCPVSMTHHRLLCPLKTLFASCMRYFMY